MLFGSMKSHVDLHRELVEGPRLRGGFGDLRLGQISSHAKPICSTGYLPYISIQLAEP